MDIFKDIIDIFLHIDEYLSDIIEKFGDFSYLILFLVIFAETGLVVAPFLPGDSLLFASGALAASGSFKILPLYIVLLLAAILGDTINYTIGHKIGPRAFKMNSGLLKKEYLEKAQAFYEKHGGKAIFFARFFPILRTFAPFVAGVGTMSYIKFISYNIIGAFCWVTLFTFLGYFFGNIPFIEDNFHYAIVFIVLISIIPIVIEVVKTRREGKEAKVLQQ
jgi:membrane-associated protein